MDWTQHCAVVIPCFNEAVAIGNVVSSARRYIPSIVVVDDGSTDGTSEVACSAGADTISHMSNQGKGAALRTGWRRARSLGFTWAITMDGDGQHSADDIPGLLSCAEQTSARLVVGDRMKHAEAMPWLRRQVNRWMTRRLSNLVGAGMADSQCGFRLVSLNALHSLPMEADHFEIESEMLTQFFLAGHKVEFVPVQTIYKSNASKIRPVVDSLRWFRWWFRQRLGRETAATPPHSACVDGYLKNMLAE